MDLFSYTAQAKFSQQHLLCLQDYTPDEIMQLLSLAAKLKLQRKMGVDQTNILKGKNIALIFTKPSMRTRVSFEAGIEQLGGHAMFITAAEIGIGTRESVYDVAHVLSRFVDGIMIRTFQQSDVEGLAKYGSIPVINGLTDDYHPCQVLADLLTLYEHKGGFKGKKLAFVGDGNNMANSLIVGGLMAGMQVSAVCPEGCEPSRTVLEYAKAYGDKFTLSTDPKAGAQGADVVYTDAWISTGSEEEQLLRRRHFRGYQVNEELLALAKPDCMVLHCLPARKGEEIAVETFERHADEIFEETENRLHAQKAVLAILMGGR